MICPTAAYNPVTSSTGRLWLRAKICFLLKLSTWLYGLLGCTGLPRLRPGFSLLLDRSEWDGL